MVQIIGIFVTMGGVLIVSLDNTGTNDMDESLENKDVVNNQDIDVNDVTIKDNVSNNGDTGKTNNIKKGYTL